SGKFPGSTLGDTLTSYPLTGGGTELAIRQEAFAQQFAADVDPATAELMAAGQRPATAEALGEGLAGGTPAWERLPSTFVLAGGDRNIPPEAVRFMAQRAGGRLVEIAGASHAVAVSHPEEVADAVL